MTFKFGRKYVPNRFELFDPKYFDIPDYNFSRSSAIYSPQGNNNPQLAMTGIKKYHQKGRFPKPRNT